MSVAVLILGESGSGKSFSIKGLDPNETAIFNVANKPLPFKGGNEFLQVKGEQANYRNIIGYLKKPTRPICVIDDSQYLMVFEEFARARESGYTKYTEMAQNYYSLVQAAIHAPDNVVVYFLHHTQTTNEGKVKAKTIGQMIDSKLTLEGLFSIVLMATATNDGHKIITQSDGITTCKSPEGMFEPEIPNSLKLIDDTIREYYGLTKEMQKQEEAKQ
jgi:hypothetical protein